MIKVAQDWVDILKSALNKSAKKREREREKFKSQ